MRYRIVYILFCGFIFSGFSQNTEDVGFIKDQSYLKYAEKIDCNNTSGSNIERRICLNIELRKVDSTMLSKFNKFVNTVENDSLKSTFLTYQRNWESERKSVSLLKAKGLNSNLEAIVYMDSMLELTQLRLNALRFILEEEED